MKWTNKGKQFEEYREKYENLKRLFVWGAGKLGAEFIENLKFLNIENDFEIIFIDSDRSKIGSKHLNKLVLSPTEFFASFTREDFLIIAADGSFAGEIISTLPSTFVRKENYFLHCYNYENDLYPDTNKMFFPLLMFYKYNKLYKGNISHILGLKCNLKCKHCLNFVQYAKNHNFINIEALKDDADALFSRFDFIDYYAINGGDPFLYEKLADLLDYLDKYRKKINKLLVVSNGTIVPSQEMISSIKRNNVSVHINDYTMTLPHYKATREKVVDVFLKNGVKNLTIYSHKDGYWFDLIDHNPDKNRTQGDLIKHFDMCNIQFSDLRNKKIGQCSYASFATTAEVIPYNENSYVDLKTASGIEIVEFLIGYSNLGYQEFCKQCAGFLTINNSKVPIAEQWSNL